MSTPTKAEQLAATEHLAHRVGWQREAAAELRRLAAVEAERDRLNRLLDEAVTRYDQMTDWFKSAQQKAANAMAERDRLAAEVERLTGCLRKANDQAEHFEREWYLRGDIMERQESKIDALAAEVEALRADAERLDWLDQRNLPMRMGWDVGCAPAGNVSVKSVIFLGRDPIPIRAAIDSARKEQR